MQSKKGRQCGHALQIPGLLLPPRLEGGVLTFETAARPSALIVPVSG